MAEDAIFCIYSYGTHIECSMYVAQLWATISSSIFAWKQLSFLLPSSWYRSHLYVFEVDTWRLVLEILHVLLNNWRVLQIFPPLLWLHLIRSLWYQQPKPYLPVSKAKVELVWCFQGRATLLWAYLIPSGSVARSSQHVTPQGIR
jgi:hypothetical protein